MDYINEILQSGDSTSLPFIVGCAWTVLALCILRYSLDQKSKFEPSKTWPTAKGKIIDSSVWLPKSVAGKRWQVKFSYQVSGNEYTRSRPALYTIQDMEMLDKAEEYRPGDDVTVYYNPKNHADGLLINGGRGGNKDNGEIILSIMAVCVGLGLMWAGFFGYIGG